MREVSESPTSQWLKTHLEATNRRDCLDAARDTEMLLSLLENRCCYTKEQILKDFSASFWLKNRIAEISHRNCLEYISDAKKLLSVIEMRCLEAGCYMHQ